jgi:hypothetical protein
MSGYQTPISTLTTADFKSGERIKTQFRMAGVTRWVEGKVLYTTESLVVAGWEVGPGHVFETGVYPHAILKVLVN